MILARPTGVVHSDQMQQRGFARAGWAHDRNEVAFLDVYVDAAEDEGLGGPVLKEFLYIAESNHSFSLSSLVTAAGSAWPRLAFIT